jgi:hypothetical protein
MHGTATSFNKDGQDRQDGLGSLSSAVPILNILCIPVECRFGRRLPAILVPSLADGLCPVGAFLSSTFFEFFYLDLPCVTR